MLEALAGAAKHVHRRSQKQGLEQKHRQVLERSNAVAGERELRQVERSGKEKRRQRKSQ